MHNSDGQFRSKREQFATQIRRQNREQILAKRRNISAVTEQQTQQATTNSSEHIIDPRFANKIKQFQTQKPIRQNFIDYIKQIHDPDPLTQHHGLIQIRKMLTQKKNPPIQQVIDAGLIPRLIAYAQQKEYPQLQLQATWCLTNVAAGNTKQTGTIIDRQGIKIFVDLLLSPHVGIVEQAVWALGNIACDSPSYRDGIIKNGGLKNLIRVVQIGLSELPKNPGIIQLIQSAIWSISGICRTQPLPNYLLIKQSLPVFFYAIKNNLIKDIAILGNICWAVSYYTNKAKEGPSKIDKIQNCIDSGVLPHIIEFLAHSYDNLVVASLKIIGNIANGNNQQSAVLFRLGVLENLEALLSKPKKVYRRDCCWVLSNLTAGPHQQIQAIFSRQSMVNKLLQLLKSDLPQIRAQICYIFTNSTQHGNPIQISTFLTQINFIEHLTDLLKQSQQLDINLLKTVLQCIQSLLYLGKKMGKETKTNFYVKQLYRLKVVEKLEELQYHEEDKIYEEISKILYGYFQLEDPLCL